MATSPAPKERTRTLRIDIAPSVYENLGVHAIEEDIGVADFVRRLIVKWSHEHPADLPPADS